MSKNIEVSVICVTFKHEQFIEKTLKGFVSQKTNFQFEVIVAEDCSPDNSRAIIKKYEKKYPHIIKPIYQRKNVGMMKNYISALKKIKGKYVAICDGDDYWIDQNKLQKQVNFLKKNKDYTVCTHLVKMVFLDKSKTAQVISPLDYVSNKIKKRGYLDFDDLFPINGISSSSVMYRWNLKKIPKWLYKCAGGDLFLHLIHADQGKIGIINELMSVYQRHPNGIWWNNNSVEHQLRFCKSYIFLLKKTNKFLQNRHHKILNTTIKKTIKNYKNIRREKSNFRTIFRILNRTINFIFKPVSPILKLKQIFKKSNILFFAFKDYISRNKIKNPDLLIIDDQFPQEKPYGFRNAEFIYLLNYYKQKIKILTKRINPPDLLGKDFFNYYKNLIGFSKKYPKLIKSIELQDLNKKYTAKLGYTIFESLAYFNLSFFEKNKIPFIFTLYPGGLFEINNKESDNRKKKIFNSKYFRKVIVTQELTKKYLIHKKICKKNKIVYIPIGISQISKRQILKKQHYGIDKKTLDICFVAFNYCKNGFYKGYDILIKVMLKTFQEMENINFHIVGNWNPDNSILKKYINKRVFFYGVKDPEFFPDFYSKMDVFISLSRKQKDGAFDGFPLGIEAGYCGVVLIASDELKQNNLFKNNQDIILTKIDSDEIYKKIKLIQKNPKNLFKISKNGRKKFQKYVDIDYQCNKRISLFNNELKIKK